MRTYYPQDNTEAFILALVVVIALIEMFTWLSDLYDLRNPLPLTPDDDDDFREVPNQREIAAAHCAKVHAKRDSADLARGTSENLRETA